MSTHLITSAFSYLLIMGLSIAVSFIFWGYFSTPAYQIVTLFIALIIISNSMAKLFTIYIDL